MFPALQLTAGVMVCILPDTPLPPVVGLASRLRQAGITVEVFPEQSKLKRQLSAADAQQIPFALILGPDEVERQTYTLKNLESGEQQTLNEEALVAALRS